MPGKRRLEGQGGRGVRDKTRRGGRDNATNRQRTGIPKLPARRAMEACRRAYGVIVEQRSDKRYATVVKRPLHGLGLSVKGRTSWAGTENDTWLPTRQLHAREIVWASEARCRRHVRFVTNAVELEVNSTPEALARQLKDLHYVRCATCSPRCRVLTVGGVQTHRWNDPIRGVVPTAVTLRQRVCVNCICLNCCCTQGCQRRNVKKTQHLSGRGSRKQLCTFFYGACVCNACNPPPNLRVKWCVAWRGPVVARAT